MSYTTTSRVDATPIFEEDRLYGIKVVTPSGNVSIVRHLLSGKKTNTKLAKSNKAGLGYITTGLSLAPAKLSGFQVCPNSTPGCRRACINTSGYGGVFPSVIEARIAKTIAYFKARSAFLRMLRRELRAKRRTAASQGKKLAVRLNVFSDIPWERKHPELFDEFPDIVYYDYLKSYTRMLDFLGGNFPENYHLTFSRSEKNDEEARRVLRFGGNVTVVFRRRPLPAEWEGYPVFDGDVTDLRFLDPLNHVIGLTAKGRGRRDTSGFVVDDERDLISLEVL